jgi:hypothetical protein
MQRDVEDSAMFDTAMFDTAMFDTAMSDTAMSNTMFGAGHDRVPAVPSVSAGTMSLMRAGEGLAQRLHQSFHKLPGKVLHKAV